MLATLKELHELPREPQSVARLLEIMESAPPFDPEKRDTWDGLGFEDTPSNRDRAAWGDKALEYFAKQTGTGGLSETAEDLVCDMLHVLHREQIDPVAVLQAALMSFVCETYPEAP
jgi:CubicO group peptidase (beta-lactamase class C family)